MKFRWISVVTLIFMAFSTSADQSYQALFDKANKHFEAGDFELARDLYLSVERQGCADPALFYNIGNTSLKLNDIGRAIGYYLRAQKIAPRDKDIQANLTLARSMVPAAIEPPTTGWILSLLMFPVNNMSLNENALIFLSLYIICASTVIAVFLSLRRKIRRRFIRIFAGAGILWIASIFYFVMAYYQMEYIERAVAIDTETIAMSGPGQHSEEVFRLQPGYEMHIRRHQSGWIEIILPNGYIGWVPETSVMVI